MDTSQANYLPIFWLVLIVIIVAIVFRLLDRRAASRASEKVEKKDGGKAERPRKDRAKEDVSAKPEEVRTGAAGSRVKRAHTTTKSAATHAKSPSEAEFVLLYSWTPSTSGLRVCACCGAEMPRTESRCPACGYTD